jgi:hypothetical protein
MAEKGVFCVLFCYIYQGFVSEFPVSGFGLRIFGVSDAWEKLGKRKKKTLASSHTHSYTHSLTEKTKESCHHNLFTNTKSSTLYNINMFSALSNTQHADCSPTALVAMASSPTGQCNKKCGDAHPCSKHDQEVTDGNCPAGGNCNWIDYGGGEGYCTKCGGYSQGY